MLKLLTIGIGLLVFVLRGIGVLSPGKLREMAEKLISSEFSTRGIGVFLIVVSVLIYFAALNNPARAVIVMKILGIVWLLGGILLVSAPAIYAAMVKWFLLFSDATIRLLCGIGVLFGILLILLGFAYY